MRKLLTLAAVASALIASAAISLATPGIAHKWKFSPTINAPWAMEDDERPLDTPLLAAGLCRSGPFNVPGAYGPLGSNVDVIAGDATNNSGFSNRGCITPQNETTIAVNPTNHNNLIAGANDYRVCCDFTGLNDGTGWAYYSFDGGATWANVQLPGLTAETGAAGVFKKFDSAGDPVVTFSPDGVAYYSNIVFSRIGPSTGIVVSVSQDGGKTWSKPNLVAYVDAANFFYDKEWIGAGPGGAVVITWTKFYQGPRGVTYLVSGAWPAIKTASVVTVTTTAPDKVFPAVAAGGGKTVVTYYTRDYGITSAAQVCNLMTNPVPSQIPPVASARSVCMDYASKSNGDGFVAQNRLSTESSNPFIQFADGAFIGDYSQVAITPDGKSAWGAWTDFRGNPGATLPNQDVMVQMITP